MDSIKDKVVLITGAGSGIGEGTAYYFLKFGSKLSLADIDSENLYKVVSTCRTTHPGCQVISTVADITKNEDRQNVIETTIKAYGKIDVLVNDAGIAIGQFPLETSEEEYDKLFDINLKSHFSLTKLAVPYLKKTKGNIVNVSSFGSVQGISSLGVYCMTKAALDMFTEVLSVELAPFGVRVNSVNPGTIRTAIARRFLNDEEYEQMMLDQVQLHPLGRIGEPEDVAKCIAFLASDMACFVTGQHLFVDGGRHCLHSGDNIKS